MALLRAQDRLQPALLDRLTDDQPESTAESLDARLIQDHRLRELVLRDLSWLFNTNAPSEDVIWDTVPEARRSVLHYGLPALSGRSASGLNLVALQDEVRRVIVDHEPRIKAATLVVTIETSNDQLDHHNRISFRIAGELWAQPVPLELLLQTDIDLESGRVAVRQVDR
jgi:type VI secretion system protein ImpF